MAAQRASRSESRMRVWYTDGRCRRRKGGDGGGWLYPGMNARLRGAESRAALAVETAPWSARFLAALGIAHGLRATTMHENGVRPEWR